MKFNIRVYAILELDRKVLVLKESYKDNALTKFPGGGLEFGEGTLDCLKRELKEELNIDLSKNKISHLYTLDYHLKSAFNPEEQLLLVYYKIKLDSKPTIQAIPSIKELLWLDKKELKKLKFTFELDSKIVNQFL